MTHTEIRKRFKQFMEAAGHRWMPSSSLLPDDPSVLFTTAGMQQFKKYYADPSIAPAKNVASIQKCLRTSDIDEVGDDSHHTFFEMLGNFSFGGYDKREAIRLAYEFVTKELGLTIDYVTVFGGEGEVPADDESESIWKELDPGLSIKKRGREDNFWGPTGDEGPCGPNTELHVHGLELWNVVFNQYYQEKDGTLHPLETLGIDTGMGMERLVRILQDVASDYDTDLFAPIMTLLADMSDEGIRRIVADHARAVCFLIADGIRPSNKDQGYVLRRLLRRMIVHLTGTEISVDRLLNKVVETYGDLYGLNGDEILHVASEETKRFDRTLQQGVRELRKLPKVDADVAFRLYESFGLPYELIKDLGGRKAHGLHRNAFDKKFREHQEKSRVGSERKFGGHGLLLDTGELKASSPEELAKVTRLHTATHLLHAALREVLGDEVQQAGSDITPERTRFDFTFPRKLTDEEKTAIEEIVNDAIKRDLPVNKAVLAKDEAEKTGALFFFKEKYPDPVNVYYTGDDMLTAFSKEFCGGPHVEHTGEIGRFRIAKEEAVGAGIRRIRATISTTKE